MDYSMNRNTALKIMAIATVFLSVVPALAYAIYYLSSVRNNTSLITARELGLFAVIAAIASIGHFTVSYAESTLGVGGAFFMVSAFIHATKIAALVLLYLSCKTTDNNEQATDNNDRAAA
jgi:hypothetical protein